MAATALILLRDHFLSLSGSDQQKAIPDEPYLGPLAFGGSAGRVLDAYA